ncbi:MAG: flagellar protein export ATPase FliI [Candidatus Eremiobacteraeota bacterium]|nr:flagellar protein export ATPase FliI [Candidatus Eremiobacteraeota bacterium]
MNEVRDKLTKKIDQSLSRIKSADLNRIYGRLIQVIGTTVESIGPPSSVGDFCWIHSNTGRRIPAEVVGFKENRVILMPFSNMSGIQPGNQVRSTGEPLRIGVDSLLLGRVLDGLGNPIDNKGEFVAEKNINVVNSPPPPLERSPINEPLSTGIRAIDGLITIGKGQRIGIFSGSGIGKSTIMGMIARNASSDVNVIGLIGERGREVPEFIKRDLTEEGLKRSVVVAVTSDKPPLLRIKGALCTTAIAEYFRDMGLNVLLMMDSATRIAMAQREIGLAVGEPPTTKGYTPSVFTLLPQILERSGTSSVGSITGIYTVLVEADDMNDPVADSMRSILDGHIVLSRSLAQKNHYPSIDVLASISRVMDQVTDKSHRESATKFRRTLARYMDSEDLINIGAYSTGTNPEIDYAIEKIDDINNYLQQEVSETTTFADTTEMLKSIFV